MRSVTRKFSNKNSIIVLHFIRRDNSVDVSGAVKKGGIVNKKKSSFTIEEFKKIYPQFTNYENSIEFFNSLGTAKKNPSEKVDDWQALLKIAAPKEGPNDTYTVDEKSSGIYTPVLEGIARANPRRMSSDGYSILSEDEHKLYMKNKDNMNDIEAYRHLFKAYRLADIACHVAYYHNARKEKGLSGSDKAVVDKLIYFHDPIATEWRDSLIKEKFEFEQYLKENKKISSIQKVKNEFKLEEKPRTIIKKSEKIPLDVSIKDDEESLESVNETIQILENSLLNKNKKHPEDVKKIEHFLEVEKKKRDKLQKIIEHKSAKIKVQQ